MSACCRWASSSTPLSTPTSQSASTFSTRQRTARPHIVPDYHGSANRQADDRHRKHCRLIGNDRIDKDISSHQERGDNQEREQTDWAGEKNREL